MGASYHVNSEHYHGEPGFKKIPVIKPTDYGFPGKNKTPMGTFSYKFGGENPTYSFDKTHGTVSFRASQAIHETSLADFKEYGNFFGKDDFEMKGWLAAANDVRPADFDVVESWPPQVIFYLIPNVGIIESKPKKLPLPHKNDTKVDLYVTDKYVLAPFNKTGYWFSRLENFKQDLSDTLLEYRESLRGEFNPELVAWLSFLEKKGFKDLHALEYLGIGIIPDDAAAATAPLAKLGMGKKIALLASHDFDQKIAAWMERYNISGENGRRLFKDFIIYHELYHFSEKGHSANKSNRSIEHKIGKLLEEFYRERAKIVSEEDASVYRALEKVNTDYAKKFSIYSALKQALAGKIAHTKKGTHIDALVERMASEALAQGYTSTAQLHAYLTAKIAEYEIATAAEEHTAESAKAKNGASAKKSKAKKGRNNDTSREHEGEHGGLMQIVNTLYSHRTSEESEASDESTESGESEDGPSQRESSESSDAGSTGNSGE